jgi:hypothetical protein
MVNSSCKKVDVAIERVYGLVAVRVCMGIAVGA